MADGSQRPIGVDAPPVQAPPGPAPEHVGSRKVATGAMTARASGGLRKLASNMADSYPEMDVHQHLQDAARELDSGRTHSAQRHVNAAIFGLQPLQLRRHGVTDDAGHMRGKAMMQQAHRHLLLIKDIEDVRGSNSTITSQRRDDQDRQAQERAVRKQQQQQQAVAASWDTHLHVIELVAVHESAAGRRALQKKGLTAYGTSYPMPNASYVGKALKAVGRVAPGKRGVLKRAIQKNAKRFGVSLKGTWAEGGAKNMGSEFNLAAYGIEDHFVAELAFRFKHGWIRIDGGGSVSPRQRAAEERASRSTAAFKGTLASRRAAAKVRPGRGAADYGAVIGDFPGMPNRGQLGKIGAAFQVGSATEAAAKGVGLPLESRPRTAKIRQQRAYRAARARGHSHNKALAIARGIGRLFEAGSAVPPASRGRLGSQVQFATGAAPFPGDWGVVELAIELFNPAGNPGQARAPSGGPIGGQFIAGGGGGAGGKKPAAAQKAPAHPTANQQTKAALLAQIKADREKLDNLRRDLKALNAGLITPQVAASNARQATASASPTPKKKGAPAKKGAAAISAKAAKAKGTAKKTAKAGAKAAPVTRQSVAAAITRQIGTIARQIAVDVKKAATLANDGQAVELVGPKGYVHGWIKVDQTKFAAGLQPGSFEHLAAIENLGAKAAMSEGDPGHDSPTMRTALHNLAHSLAGRDIEGARAHLESAKWANTHEAGGKWTRDLAELDAQLQHVPKAATGWRERRYNPISVRGQHPRHFVPTPAPPAHVTAGALAIGYSWEGVENAIELANGKQYRYKHGWIRLEQAIRSRYHGNEPSPRGRGTASAAYPDAAMLQVATGTAVKGKLGVKFEPGSAAAAMVGRHMSRHEAAGVTNMLGAGGKGVHYHVSKQAARNQAITGVAGISGPFGRHLSKAEARGFAGMFGGSRRKQKLYGALRKGGPQHNKARAVLAQARSIQMATELSANTARLSVTPAPRGKPGGPGLYDIKGEGHTPYLQQIVKALIEKRGMPEGKAYAIARAAIRRWSAGGGHVHPEVRAAAGKAESGELAKQARAKAA